MTRAPASSAASGLALLINYIASWCLPVTSRQAARSEIMSLYRIEIYIGFDILFSEYVSVSLYRVCRCSEFRLLRIFMYMYIV